MVFYKLNYNKFPIVEIIFKGEIIDEDLDRFFDEWLKIYDREKNFELYIYTKNKNIISTIPKTKYHYYE
jgi:hypothetical protein